MQIFVWDLCYLQTVAVISLTGYLAPTCDYKSGCDQVLVA